jgi:sialic acid synthase SpsE
LLKYIARKKKPIILSTGMSTLGEIEEALGVLRKEGAEEIILLHCVSCYPAASEDINLRAMDTLKRAFKLPVGLSDHTLGIAIPIAAVALGARVIEKHFTLDRHFPGPDHRASLEPGELKHMVKAIRDVEKALGDGIKRLAEEEEENKELVRRSLVAKVDIAEGTMLAEEMLDIKRPAGGIEPKYVGLVVGRRAKKDIAKDSLIMWEEV